MGRGEGGPVISGAESGGGGRGCLTTLVRGVYYHLHIVRRERSFKQGSHSVICVSKSTLALFRIRVKMTTQVRDDGGSEHAGSCGGGGQCLGLRGTLEVESADFQMDCMQG